MWTTTSDRTASLIIPRLLFVMQPAQEPANGPSDEAASSGGPPPPPPPAPPKPSSQSSSAAPVKLKTQDVVPFESLQKSRAGERLFQTGHTWHGPVHWKASKGWRQYTPGSIAAPSTLPATLKLVTYNVLFTHSCMGEQRKPVILSQLHQCDADIICIPEGMRSLSLSLSLAASAISFRSSLFSQCIALHFICL